MGRSRFRGNSGDVPLGPAGFPLAPPTPLSNSRCDARIGRAALVLGVAAAIGAVGLSCHSESPYRRRFLWEGRAARSPARRRRQQRRGWPAARKRRRSDRGRWKRRSNGVPGPERVGRAGAGPAEQAGTGVGRKRGASLGFLRWGWNKRSRWKQVGGRQVEWRGRSRSASVADPIRVPIWIEHALVSSGLRVGAIPSSRPAKRATTTFTSTQTYAHTQTVQEGPADSTFDASVFTDEGLGNHYDVVLLFLNPSGTRIDDQNEGAVRRQPCRTSIEKKGRGFVRTLSATWAYPTQATWVRGFHRRALPV